MLIFIESQTETLQNMFIIKIQQVQILDGYILKIKQNQTMKGQQFLLAFTKGKKQEVKGKNIFPQAKISKGKPILKSQKQISDKQSEASKSSSNIEKKPKIVAQIQKLQKQLQQTDEHIKQTQKKLDVDLFLKQQKQKRQLYAKDINQEYQIQKKKREQILYKKYRQKQQTQSQKNQELKNTKNVKTAFPLQLLKILQNQKITISKSNTIVNGHNLTLDMVQENEKLNDVQKINQEEKQLLLISGGNDQNQKEKTSPETFTTMSLKKIAQNMLNVNYFPVNFQNSMLQINEEYENIMSALTLMPDYLSIKYYLYRQIKANPYFICKFFFNGQSKSVVTSDLIETRQFVHRHINLHSKMSDNRSFGPTIVEKCYRKVSNSYEYLDLRASIFTLYGLDAQIIDICNKNYIKQNFLTVLKFLIQTEQIVSFMNDDGHNSTLYENRLYKLKQIVDTVQLSEEDLHKDKNKKKKNKDKQNQNQKQKNIIAQPPVHKILYHFLNPYKGLVLASNNMNKFSQLQTFQKFNKLVLIRDYPKNWSCKRIPLEIFSLGSISLTNNQWTKNNQYHFCISKEVNLRIVMRKKQISQKQAIIKKQQNKEDDLDANNLYGFLIFLCRQGQQKITCMKTDCLIARPKSTDSLEYPSYSALIPKGNYIIIPYSNKVSKTSYQFFNLDFFIEKSESISFGKSIINEWKWVKQTGNKKQQTTDDQKIIQSLQNRQYIQRIKLEDIQIPKISSFGVNAQKIIPTLQQNNMVLGKNIKLTDLLIPGKTKGFLINPEIQSSKAPVQVSKKKKDKIFSKKGGKQSKIQITRNDEVESLQKQQALQIMLGYDILQSQDINRGLMMQQMQNNEQVLDFQHFSLGYDGLTAIMETLMSYPSIRKLNLASNQLDDTSIIFLCHYLEKGNRVELRELNVRCNQFGKTGMRAITGLMQRYKELQVMVDQVIR